MRVLWLRSKRACSISVLIQLAPREVPRTSAKMVRWSIAAALLAALLIGTDAHRCNREPNGYTTPRSTVGNHYRIQISGHDDTYRPGETYRVSLVADRNGAITKAFTGFSLTVDPEMYWGTGSTAFVGNMSIESDGLTAYSDRCPNTVVQTSTIAKTEIQVLWRAPATGSGCVLFRAMVIEHPNVWYMDDGRLTLRLCETQQANHDKQPEVIEPCCACEEAKYEMTFEGMWSRHTHPKDFPDNNWLTRFSDVIGASHTAYYDFWKYNGYASEGLREVAEHGTTRVLESELKNQSQHIRTIIKARGIGYPNVTGKTFAVFRVDHKHHLMSIVSMIYPSPDWIVGVSRLELCLKNCSWVENIMLNLYPWDVGTDAGITYMSEDAPLVSPERISRITSRNPNNESSPFYDPNGSDIKPLARIYLTRQRLYEKSCSNDSTETSMPSSSSDYECSTSNWSPYEDCIPECGPGWRRAQRQFLNSELAHSHGCKTPLTKREKCYNAPCTGPETPRPSSEGNRLCEVTSWSEWSECSGGCGGTKTRERSYKWPSGQKQCSVFYDAPQLQETMRCNEDKYNCGSEEVADICDVTQWSVWSPCSVTCGNGTRVRTRMLMSRIGDVDVMERDGEDIEDDSNQTELGENNSLPDCSEISLTESRTCKGKKSSCQLLPEEALVICKLQPEPGPCRQQRTIWYFDVNTGTCEEFNYGGCAGNRNKFETQEECMQSCRPLTDGSTTDPTTSDPLNGMTPWSHIKYPDLPSMGSTTGPPEENSAESTIPPPEGSFEELRPINCKVTHWSDWSSCSVTCGRGFQFRIREIKVHPRNNGTPCKKLKKRKKCHLRKCNEPSDPMQSDESPYSMGEDRWPYPLPVEDCVLSEWSAWSHCSMSCGIKAVKQRTRSIVVPPSAGGQPCDERIQTEPCAVSRCN